MASILIVEDDITFGTMINSWLRRKGFVSEKVSSVSAAKSKLQDSGNTYDLILSDLRLPDHDGLVLLEWMRQCDMDIPFIVMTSYAEVQNAVLAMKSGAADYIAKPLQPDVLLQKINDALSKRPAQVAPIVATAQPSASTQTVPRHIEGTTAPQSNFTNTSRSLRPHRCLSSYSVRAVRERNMPPDAYTS